MYQASKHSAASAVLMFHNLVRVMLSCIQAVQCLSSALCCGSNLLALQLSWALIIARHNCRGQSADDLEQAILYMHTAYVSVTAQQDVCDHSMHLPCRPDLFALPLSRVSGIQAQAYHLLGWSEPWAPSAVGNSSFMFAESGQFLLDR